MTSTRHAGASLTLAVALAAGALSAHAGVPAWYLTENAAGELVAQTDGPARADKPFGIVCSAGHVFLAVENVATLRFVRAQVVIDDGSWFETVLQEDAGIWYGFLSAADIRRMLSAESVRLKLRAKPRDTFGHTEVSYAMDGARRIVRQVTKGCRG